MPATFLSILKAAGGVKQEKANATAGTAGSRSTSAGSSLPHSRNAEDSPKLRNLSCSPDVATDLGLPDFEYPSSFAMQTESGLPDMEYPAPYLIKNTFIETNFFGPTSLDGFLNERKIQSCPVSGIGAPPGLETSIEPEMVHRLQQPPTPDAESFARAVALAALDAEVESDVAGDSTPSPIGLLQQPAGFGFDMHFPALPPPPAQDMPVFDCLMPPPPQEPPVFSLELDTSFVPPPPETSALAPVLRLADALPEPELGSSQLPTIGSAGHRTGDCKPCAFFHSKGCGNGTQCNFCHLCAPGEKKRRLKEKRAMQQAVANTQWPAMR
mmetsp:Transcript_89713/g.168942  ORF Transcript_89713/g.168942 Transcript_89713/m.168942 type:complete len:326 (-) Transcript_89713:165-1142(-)